MRIGVDKLEQALQEARRAGPGDALSAWDRLARLPLDPRHLARARVVAHDKRQKLHTPFDMLRARVLRKMKANGWRSIAITSPTPGCGKTTVSLNLGFSLARRLDGHLLLAELDLVRPHMAKALGIKPPRSILELFLRSAAPEEVFVRLSDSFAAAFAGDRRSHSAEILQSSFCAEALLNTIDVLRPDIVIYDLPPVFAVDDALAFAPRADCALVVAAEGESRLDDIHACVAQLSKATEILGVVLNKSVFPTRGAYGYYGDYGY
jgi:Mrp family chromosome partitioning ATPase